MCADAGLVVVIVAKRGDLGTEITEPEQRIAGAENRA